MATILEMSQNTATSPEDPEVAEKERVRKFLETAISRFKLSSEAFATIRRESLDDMKFRVGEQWPADIKSQRDADQRPCLTMNRLPQFIRQVTNEYRANRPGVQIRPAGSGATTQTAEVFEGLCRHIQTQSDSAVAFDTAFDAMVTGGMGAFRVVTEYCDDETFDQEIYIKLIKNIFTVYWDPAALLPDFSDADYCFVIEDMSAAKFRAHHGKSATANLSDFSSIGDNAPGWGSRDLVRVAEYWYIEYDKKKLMLLDDGRILEAGKDELADNDVVIRTRDVITRKVKCAKITGVEILEERDWAGKWIPIIPVVAEDLDVDGTRYISGLVRHAKDPMRMYNYWITNATETIALAPKAPYIAAYGQTEDYDSQWQSANVKNYAVLKYKPMTVDGQTVPPPQRQQYEPPIQAMAVMTKQADNDLKATTGIYDASLGQRGPDESGRALMMRQKQSSIGNLNFSDNFSRSLRFLGRILVDLIPHIYDAPRIQRIVNPDGTVKSVGVFNGKQTGTDQATVLQDPEMAAIGKVFDIGVGRYDVVVSTGPSYETKRQETVESIMSLVQSFPNIMTVAGDLLVQNMDWAGAQEIANRLKTLLPPSVKLTETDDPKQEILKLQGQLEQMGQLNQALTMELNKVTDVVKTKRLETESRERIAAQTNQTNLIIADVKVRGEAALAALNKEMETIGKRIEHLQALELQENELNAAKEQAAAQPQEQGGENA